MPRVDFLISNDRHHADMVLPVVETLTDRPDCSCRIISLCEFRGMASPAKAFRRERVVFKRAVPFRVRSSPTMGLRQGPRAAGVARILARDVSWRFVLAPRLRSL